MSLKNKGLVALACVLLLCSNVSWALTKKQTIDNYLKYSSIYFKQQCNYKAEKEFDRLYRNYSQQRFFIPAVNGALDELSVREILPVYDEKLAWIDRVYNKLNRTANFNQSRELIRQIKILIDRNLAYKRTYNQAPARKIRSQIKNKFNKLVSYTPYLQSFRFPVDHLADRQQYDEAKFKRDFHLMNRIYLERKLKEDGAQNRNGSRNDMYLRTTLNTVYLKLQDDRNFIEEDLRYDLVWVLNAMDKQLRSGKQVMLTRLKNWKAITLKNKKFYLHLTDKVQNNQNLGGELLKKQAASTFKLKKYVMQKQANAFKFWSSFNPLYQKLFAIETILFNEVGTADPYGDERVDIVRLLKNRSKIPYYSTIGLNDSIFYYLPNSLTKDPLKYPWLNLLFKEGEFSFTYFYLPGTVRIFCPDQTKIGMKLRRQNLRIAYNVLNESKPFSGIRYFSRESMVGRIDMAKAWTNFSPMAERPSSKVYGPKYLKQYKRGKFKHLYHFIDENKRRYEVVDIKGKNYVIDLESNIVFGHRNPHKFKFFR